MYIKVEKMKLLVIFIFILASVFQGISVYADENTVIVSEDIKQTDEMKSKASDVDGEFENKIRVDEVRKIMTNQLGLKRINEYRRNEGLYELSLKTCEFGDEIIKNTDTVYEEISIDDLPSCVDNSELKSFPPIGDQGYLNSCASYATTYYQLTHMFGLKLGWDVKNDTENKQKFSPKWTFNLTNAGENGVFGIESAYQVFYKSGAALWNDFPYNGEDINPQNYTQWPTESSVWRNALNYRIKDFGEIRIWDGTNTPVKSTDSPNLNKVKQLLNNGYVLTFDTNLSTWRYSKICDDTSTSKDDDYINQNIAHITDTQLTAMDGHVMTLVGYNDNIWVDINENGIVDTGEKGAFKIANSWGKEGGFVMVMNKFPYYSNDGFIWLSYDTMNKVSSVPECPISERTNSINSRNKLHWICPKEAETPKLLIEYTVNHTNKYELETFFGYSNYYENNPVSFFGLDIMNCPTHIKSSFDGTNNSCDATFVFDISELYDRFDSTKGNLYVSFADLVKGNPCTVKSVKVIDNVSGETYYYDGELPITFDNTELTIGPIGFKKKLTSLRGIKFGSNEMPTQRNSPAVVELDEKFYVIGGEQKGEILNDVEVYDPQNCTWEKKKDLTGEQSNVIKAVNVNNKIYAIKRLSSGESVIEEYDAKEDKWIYKKNINNWEVMDVGQANGKIYIVGTNDYHLKENTRVSIEEYDVNSNTITDQIYMTKGLRPFVVEFMDDKIYMFNLGIYNPNIAKVVGDNQFEMDKRLRVYNTVSKSWYIGKEVEISNVDDIIVFDDKFYLFWYDVVQQVLKFAEYDPINEKLKKFDKIYTDMNNFGIATYNGNVITFGGSASKFVFRIFPAPMQIINIDQDKIPPILEPPADLTLATTEELTVVDIKMADAFGNSNVKVSNNAPKAFPIGTTNILWSAEDEDGNKTHAIQKVTMVVDKEAPELIVPKDIVIGTNTDRTVVDLGEATASDLFDVSITNDAPQSFPLGKTIVNWSAIDANGNEVSKTQQVNVYRIGDIDSNGEVNAIDFEQLRKFLLGYKSVSLSELQKYAADVDGNNSINAIDFASIRKYLLGFIDGFSAVDK